MCLFLFFLYPLKFHSGRLLLESKEEKKKIISHFLEMLQSISIDKVYNKKKGRKKIKHVKNFS